MWKPRKDEIGRLVEYRQGLSKSRSDFGSKFAPQVRVSPTLFAFVATQSRVLRFFIFFWQPNFLCGAM